MSAQVLRPYQRQGVERLSQLLARHRRVLLVGPTGMGKTSIIAEVISRTVARGTKAAFIAHRKELIDQCSTRLDEWNVPHGIIQANRSRREPDALVQVASVQTLDRRNGGGLSNTELLIVDEAHRATAESYRRVIARYPTASVVGLTATPTRLDGKGLGDLFDAMLIVAQPDELVADGYLLEPTIFAGPEIDTTGVHLRQGDFMESELAAAADKPRLIGDIVANHAHHIGRGKRSVVFASGIDHAKHVSDAFVAAGIPAAHIEGEMPADERAVALGRLNAGEIEVLTNHGILTEGWDLPLLDAVILARPTLSTALCLQMIGRVLRPYPGKQRALVLDHAGNVRRHGWPTAPRDWALDGLRNQPTGGALVRTCPKCAQVVPLATKACPTCSHQFREDKRDVVTTGGMLIRIDRHAVDGRQHSALVELIRAAIRRDFALPSSFPGWAAHQYRKRFGEWPSEPMKRRAFAEVRRAG